MNDERKEQFRAQCAKIADAIRNYEDNGRPCLMLAVLPNESQGFRLLTTFASGDRSDLASLISCAIGQIYGDEAAGEMVAQFLAMADVKAGRHPAAREASGPGPETIQ